MGPEIIYEDEDLLVLDKPAGIVVDRSSTRRERETIQDWVEGNIKNQKSNIKNINKNLNIREYLDRVGIVHRLDKETSGVLLVAKTAEAFGELQSQFKNRTIKKTYLALVHGRVVPAEGEISAPVARTPWNKERQGIVPGGREAKTRYKLLTTYNLFHFVSQASQGKQSEIYSLLEVYPKTGRTHQIRVHLKYLGYPIVSDEFYAGGKTARSDRQWCPRLFLHAAKISFLHPVTNRRIEFTSVLPADLEKVLRRLRELKDIS